MVIFEKYFEICPPSGQPFWKDERMDKISTLLYDPTFLTYLRQLNVHDMLPTLSDEKILVQQCRAGNRNAQKILYERHYPKMLPVTLRYLKNEEEALEILNDAFLKVFTKINQYKSEGSLEGWIRRIVINTSI